MKHDSDRFLAGLAVPGLLLLYVAVANVVPSPFLTLLPGIAVVLATLVWEMRGGMLAALAAAPCLAWGLWRLVSSPVLTDLAEHDGFVVGWVTRGYIIVWITFAVLAGVVSVLAHRSRQLVQANRDLNQAQQRLTALHQIALSLSTTLDVSRLLETILEQLGQLWGYTHGAILLLDEATDELVVTAAREYANGIGCRFPSGAGVTGQVVQTGRPVQVGDVMLDSRYIDGVAGARSELAVPLVWEGRILGVLNVESHTPDAYGQNDLDLLATVAEQAAASIGNARLHQQTRDMAITDPHTGLFNYRHFQDQMTAAVRDAQLMGTTCSLLMLDLDLFKRCNDTYGHPTGDAVLQQFARVLRDSCRSVDLVFRYGGEEFAIILPGAPEDAALRVAERIRERAAGHPFVTRSGRRLDFPVTVSIGVASYPKHGLTHVELLIAADTALYAAKAAGRNRVVTASAGSHAAGA
jgi:diguanylate cyclase (GGDEF)-like protein